MRVMRLRWDDSGRAFFAPFRSRWSKSTYVEYFPKNFFTYLNHDDALRPLRTQYVIIPIFPLRKQGGSDMKGGLMRNCVEACWKVEAVL